MEYAAAKARCRQCGRYFLRLRQNPALSCESARKPVAPVSSSILGKFEDFGSGNRAVIECFECKRKQQVCGSYLDNLPSMQHTY
jgi:hypothetical protein